jgi:hypothetical protein
MFSSRGLLLAFGIVLFVATAAVVPQTDPVSPAVGDDVCGQPKNIREELIDEAERQRYNIVWVEVSGNESIRYREFRKRFARGLEEGDIFTRKKLDDSLKRLSKFRKIHPVSIENVMVRLDRENPSIDVVFCVTER